MCWEVSLEEREWKVRHPHRHLVKKERNAEVMTRTSTIDQELVVQAKLQVNAFAVPNTGVVKITHSSL